MMIFVLAPPAIYDHPFRGHVIEMVMPLQKSRTLCGRRGAYADACSWTTHGKCYVVIPQNGPVKSLKAYRRHEVAHCNGWPEGHGAF